MWRRDSAEDIAVLRSKATLEEVGELYMQATQDRIISVQAVFIEGCVCLLIETSITPNAIHPVVKLRQGGGSYPNTQLAFQTMDEICSVGKFKLWRKYSLITKIPVGGIVK